MDGFATFEVTLAGLGGEVATGAERGRYKNYSNNICGESTIPFYSVFRLLS